MLKQSNKLTLSEQNDEDELKIFSLQKKKLYRIKNIA